MQSSCPWSISQLARKTWTCLSSCQLLWTFGLQLWLNLERSKNKPAEFSDNPIPLVRATPRAVFSLSLQESARSQNLEKTSSLHLDFNVSVKLVSHLSNDLSSTRTSWKSPNRTSKDWFWKTSNGASSSKRSPFLIGLVETMPKPFFPTALTSNASLT